MLPPSVGELGEWLESAESAVLEAIENVDSTKEGIEARLVGIVRETREAINAARSGGPFDRQKSDSAPTHPPRVRYRQSREREFVGMRTEERHYLLEEMTCDLVATDITIGFFGEMGIAANEVLQTILHGFLNHGSIEEVRDLANEHVPYAPHAGVIEVNTRKTVWNWFAATLRAHRSSDPDALLEGLDSVSTLHARVVGERLLFKLPEDFSAACRAVPQLHPPVAREALVGQLHHYLASEARQTRAQALMTGLIEQD